jgi:hypothetical protein
LRRSLPSRRGDLRAAHMEKWALYCSSVSIILMKSSR